MTAAERPYLVGAIARAAALTAGLDRFSRVTKWHEESGMPVRDADDACPFCGADVKSWCAPDCRTLDLGDYR